MTGRRSVIALILVLPLLLTWWSSTGRQVSAAVLQNRASAPQQVVPTDTPLPGPPPVSACVPLQTPPTATPTSTPSPTPSPSPTATANVTATPAPTLTPTPIPGPVSHACVVDLQNANAASGSEFAEAFNALGATHTFTFVCEQAAGTLSGLTNAPYPTTGCFDVTATLTDLVTSAHVPFNSATCAGISIPGGPTIACGNVVNPICAAGYASAGGACEPCPTGFHLRSDNQCHTAPVGTTCPPGSTPVTNPGGGVVDCVAPLLTTAPGQQNVASFTISPTSPHPYRIDVTGYVGTDAAGNCPTGTTYTASAPLDGFTAPACAFRLSLLKKYVEVNHLTVQAQGPCGGSVSSDLAGSAGGSPCFFTVRATGVVILKLDVNCSDAGEIAGITSGLSGYPPGSVIECSNNALSVNNIPVPRARITLTATNGLFNPNCIPESWPHGTTATATPVGIPTDTPIPSPTPTSTPTPFGATATPVPAPTTFSRPAFCFRSGSPTITVTTDDQGVAGVIGNSVGISATAQATGPGGGDVTTTGSVNIDGAIQFGSPMYTVLNYPSGQSFCPLTGPIPTIGPTGFATCSQSVGSAPMEFVPTDVSFVLNCEEYGISIGFIAHDPSFVGQGSGTIQPQQGICVVRIGNGPLSVTASYASTLNNQLPVSATTTIGEFGPPTPAGTSTATTGPIPFDTATPVPTRTPVPTPTNTPAPVTPTDTPVPSPVSSATPVSTPSPATLKYRLDAARVSTPNNPGNLKGLDHVRRGQKVWLMMYYTVSGVPKPVTRVTNYQIRAGGAVIYRVSYKGTQKAGETGHFSRFSAYTIPKSLPYGMYSFQAQLQMGSGKTQSLSWSFAVVRSGYFLFDWLPHVGWPGAS